MRQYLVMAVYTGADVPLLLTPHRDEAMRYMVAVASADNPAERFPEVARQRWHYPDDELVTLSTIVFEDGQPVEELPLPQALAWL